MNLSSLIEKRNALMTQISTLAKNDSLSSEQRSQFDVMASDLESLNADVQRAELAANLEQQMRSQSRPPRSNPGEQRQNADNEAEVTAFENYIKYGTRSSELRSIGSGPVAGNVTASGSVFIPSGVGDLTIVKKTFGNLASAVRNLVTDSGDAMSFPVIDDVAQNDLFEIAELTNTTQAEPVLTGAASTVDLLTSKSIVVSNNLLADSAFNVQNWVNEILTTRVTNGLSKRLYAGNGGSFGSLVAAAPTKVTTLSGTAISWSELTQLYGSIDAAYRANASWVFSSATHAYLMGITNPATGQPILQPDVHGNAFGTLLGRPVVIAENAASVALGTTPILFGDLSTVTLRSVRNASVIRQNELYSNQNATGFVLFYRAGSVITSQASSPAIVSLKMKAS